MKLSIGPLAKLDCFCTWKKIWYVHFLPRPNQFKGWVVTGVTSPKACELHQSSHSAAPHHGIAEKFSLMLNLWTVTDIKPIKFIEGLCKSSPSLQLVLQNNGSVFGPVLNNHNGNSSYSITAEKQHWSFTFENTRLADLLHPALPSDALNHSLLSPPPDIW